MRREEFKKNMSTMTEITRKISNGIDKQKKDVNWNSDNKIDDENDKRSYRFM